MKKILALLLAISVVFISACTKQKPAETEKPKVTETEEVVDEFYTMMQKDNRPIAVMIDNDSEDSRPQIGLESAYMVYEIIVEGGATRFMALFKDYSQEKVGPVRSSRHYFLDYALEHDAIYALCMKSSLQFSSVESLSRVRFFASP